MSNPSQKRAIEGYRRRLTERGLARFEVLGLEGDRELVRSVARRLAQDDAGARHLRAEIARTVTGEPPRRGGILAALRRSPLVGADFGVTRDETSGRDLAL